MAKLAELGFNDKSERSIFIIPQISDVQGTFPDLSFPNDKIENLNVNKLTAGSLRVSEYMQSTGFVSGSVGWKINGNGSAEFVSVTLTGGTIKYGKTAFSDTTNAGWIIDPNGIFFGNASDTKHLKYTIGSGVFEVKGNVITALQAGSDVDGQYLTAATVANAKRTVSYEVNLCLNKYADFEQYVNGDTIGTEDNATCTADTTNFIFGTKSLKIVTTAAFGTCYFGATTTTYNIPVEPSTKYIVSFWAKGNAGGESVRTGLRVNNGDAFRDYDNITITSSWVRYYRTITLQAGDTAAELTFGSPDDATTFWIDGVMLEEASAATSPEPSAWRPGATTEIYGDNLIPLSIAQLSTIAQLINNTDVSLVENRANYPWTKGVVKYFDNDGFGLAGVLATRYVGETVLGVTAGDSPAYVRSGALSLANTWGIDASFITVCTLVDVAEFDAFVGLHGAATTVPTTAKHIGFYFDNGTIYASNANDTTQTTTNVSAGITVTNLNSYRFEWNNGTNIKFYINDTLVATHTTNLPSGAGGNAPKIHTVAQWNGVAGSGRLHVKHGEILSFDL